MAKIIQLYPESIFLDAVPEFHKDLIERVNDKTKHTKQ